jgi:hypothetical protein
MQIDAVEQHEQHYIMGLLMMASEPTPHRGPSGSLVHLIYQLIGCRPRDGCWTGRLGCF